MRPAYAPYRPPEDDDLEKALNAVPEGIRQADFVSEDDILSAGGGAPSVAGGEPVVGSMGSGPVAPTPASPVPQGPSREEFLRKVLEQQQAHDTERASALSAAARKDRKRQSESNVREYLRAAFGGGQPQLRNVGTSYTDEAKAEGNQGPLSRELQLQAILSKYDKKPEAEDPEMRAAKLKMLLSQSSMYDRANQPKPLAEPKPVNPLDEEMKRADIELKKKRASYLGKGAGRVKPDGERPLSPQTVIDLADFETSAQQLRQLGDDFERYDVSGFMARPRAAVSKALGLSNDYTEFMDRALLAMQGVGKIMEGGKLQAGDEVKYRSLLPQPGESSERAKKKIEEAISFLAKLKENRLKALKAGGFKVESSSSAPVKQGVTVKDLSDGTAVELTADEWAEVQSDPDWKKKVEVVNGR